MLALPLLPAQSIQQEIDYISSRGGGVYEFDTSYTIDRSIIVPDNVMLTARNENVVIKASPNFRSLTLSAMRPAMFINQPESRGIGAIGFTIDANVEEQLQPLCGVCFQQSENVYFERMHVKNAGREGPMESQSIWVRRSRYIDFLNCREDRCDGFTISVSSNFTVRDCQSYDSTSEGVFIGWASNGKVTNCTVLDAAGAGISATAGHPDGQVSDVLIDNCTTRRCGFSTINHAGEPTDRKFSGISIGTGASDITVSNSTSTGNEKSGISMFDLNRGTIENNFTADNKIAGIQYEKTRNVGFINNDAIFKDDGFNYDNTFIPQL